jgi:hypothetical protein
MIWNRAASRTPGSGRNATAWIQEKTATLKPIPMASEPTITAATQGIRPIMRHAWRRSRVR